MFNLQSVINSRDVYHPQRIMLYGVQGIGKSSCAATFASPILLRTEDGVGALDVPTFPEVATTYEQLGEAIGALYHEEHTFKTLILDSLDWTEPLIWRAVCNDHLDGQGKPLANIEAIGYGKGYVEADNKWREVMGWLDMLRAQKGMQIVVIAHSAVVTFNPPDGESFDRYQPKLHKRAFGLWQEWADEVLFLNYRRRIVTDEHGKRRAEGEGNRVIFTQERPAFLAKNRWNLPQEITVGQDKSWKPLHDALANAIGAAYPYPFESKKGDK